MTAGSRAEVHRKMAALSHPRFTHPADALAWLSGLGPREFARVAGLLLGSPPRPPASPPVRLPAVLPLDESVAETISRYGITVGAPESEVRRG